MGEKLKKVGERSKAGQKLNRKRGISETKLQSRQSQGQGAKRTFYPKLGILDAVPEGSRKKKKEKKSAALKVVVKTQNWMRKVCISQVTFILVSSFFVSLVHS